eukprot:2128587-Rhodomonas_salina.1
MESSCTATCAIQHPVCDGWLNPMVQKQNKTKQHRRQGTLGRGPLAILNIRSRSKFSSPAVLKTLLATESPRRPASLGARDEWITRMCSAARMLSGSMRFGAARSQQGPTEIGCLGVALPPAPESSLAC